jgi:hypothetical protein
LFSAGLGEPLPCGLSSGKLGTFIKMLFPIWKGGFVNGKASRIKVQEITVKCSGKEKRQGKC